jgi:hypothetical protein
VSLARGEQRACEGCGAKIVGATKVGEPDGTVAPITGLPAENGNVLLWRDVEDGGATYAVVGNVRTAEYLRALGVPLRLNHFADCPERRRFERGRR